MRPDVASGGGGANAAGGHLGKGTDLATPFWKALLQLFFSKNSWKLNTTFFFVFFLLFF